MITIIALCWNHLEDVTKPFVKSFLANTTGDYELIMFDNGSHDGTKKFIQATEKKHPKVKYAGTKHNLGFGAGNNKAYKYKSPKSTHVLFINNDIVFHNKNWLQLLKKEIEPKTIIGQELVDFNSATSFRDINQPYLNGWCFMFPVKFLEKHGAFDEDFYIAYFEDAELCIRAGHHGYKLKAVDLGVEHLGSKSSDQISIPEKFKYNQYIFRNKLYEYERGNKLRIVFFCKDMYPFTGDDYEGKGVGGAEASLILLTRELAKLGHVVDIYNDTEVQGKYDGVNYINIENFSYNDYSDVFIVNRNSMPGLELVNAKVKLFWSCDQFTTNDWAEEIIPFVDKTFAISPYHKKYIAGHYPFSPGTIDIIDLGVKAEDYMEEPKKTGNKMIFCSVPRRGLEHLAHAFPEIKKRIPDAELVITSDYTLWGAEPLNEQFKSQFANMDGVRFLGKVERSELVKEQRESKVMAYPCTYDENFCISAMECIAAGAVPVTTPIGAMRTTIGDSGIIIESEPGTVRFQEEFVNRICQLLEDEDLRMEFQKSGRKRALSKYTWDYLAKEFWEKPILKMVKEKKYKNAYCTECKKQFKSSFAFFKHRSEKHVVLPPTKKNMQKLKVKIRVNKRVELNIGGVSYNTSTEMIVPQAQSGDMIRVLTEAYGEGVVKDVKILMNIDN